jgi:hypothetical protein
MGLLRRIVTAVEHKLDGPPKPPPHVWPGDQAWARLLTWERNPGSVGAPNRNGASSMLDDLIDKGRSIAYRFRLEVHRPGRAAYELTRDIRVPRKVEGTLFLESQKTPAGAEVPLRVTGTGAEEIELDWDAYMAIPDQSARAYHLRIRNGYTPSGV